MSNNYNKRNNGRLGKMIGGEINTDPNHYKNTDPVVTTGVKSEPAINIPGAVVMTTGAEPKKETQTRQEKEFYDPNYKNGHKQNGNSNNQHNKYKNFRDPRGPIKEEKMEAVTRLGAPLSIVYADNSVSILKEFRDLLKERMPEFSKCVGAVELVPYEYEVRDAANMPRKITSAKLILKCRFEGSIYSSRKANPNQEFGDPAFAALVARASGKSNNRGDLPGDLKTVGKGILFDDGIDIIKYEKFVDKEGRTWDDLVLIETSLDAAIVALTGMPANEYTGYVSDIVRAKEIETKLIAEQRKQGIKVGHVSAIYIVRMTLDSNKVLAETMKYFKKYKNDGKGNNNGRNSYRSAEDQFFSK